MKNETTAVEVVCPHCKTRWTWSEDNWFAVIKRHGSGCRCPDNWICTLCSKRCVEPTDVTQYLKNGAHVDCADKELHGELRFPKCECGCTRGRHAGPNAEEYCLRSKCSCDEYRPVTTASPATAGYEACQERSTSQIAALRSALEDYAGLAREMRAISNRADAILQDCRPDLVDAANNFIRVNKDLVFDDLDEALATPADPVREAATVWDTLQIIANMRVYLGTAGKDDDPAFMRDFYAMKLDDAIKYAETALEAK